MVKTGKVLRGFFPYLSEGHMLAGKSGNHGLNTDTCWTEESKSKHQGKELKSRQHKCAFCKRRHTVALFANVFAHLKREKNWTEIL